MTLRDAGERLRVALPVTPSIMGGREKDDDKLEWEGSRKVQVSSQRQRGPVMHSACRDALS